MYSFTMVHKGSMDSEWVVERASGWVGSGGHSLLARPPLLRLRISQPVNLTLSR